MATKDAGKQMEAIGVTEALREYLPLLSPLDRLELFERLTHGYCIHCGEVIPQGFGCYCLYGE